MKNYLTEKLSPLKGFNKTLRFAFKAAWTTDKRLTTILLTLLVASAALPYLQLGILGLIVDEVIEVIKQANPILTPRLRNLVLLEVVLVALPTFVSHASQALQTMFRFKYLQHLNINFFRRLGNLDLARYEDPKFQDTLQLARERGLHSVEVVWRVFQSSLRDTLGVVIAGAILASINWVFLVLAFVGTIPALIIGIKHGNYVYWIWDNDAEKRRTYHSHASHFENRNSLTELKLYQGAEFFLNKITALLGNLTKLQIKAEHKNLRMKFLGTIVFATSLGMATYLLIQQTLIGVVAVGTMTFVFGSLRGFQGTLSSLFENINGLFEYHPFAKNVLAVLEAEPLLPSSEHPQKLDLTKTPKVEFRNVWFRYANNLPWVLQDINLIINPGQNLSVVGINGAGKTTFVKLLARVYDPTKGQILINDIDLRELDPNQWLEAMAILFQEYTTYMLPVRESIAMGRSNVPLDDGRVQYAANKSQADQFIQKFDKSYDQMIGKEFTNGIDLSVGQNQRMAIARVFYRQAPIVILDEPTASIDALAEEEIFSHIHSEMQVQTLITISHRFSTVKQSDKICVLENGTISEYGSHADLMNNPKTYAKMFNAQAKAYNS